MITSLSIGPEDEELRTTKQRVINKIIWLTGTSRNALLVIICGVLGYYFSETSPFHLTGQWTTEFVNICIFFFSFTLRNSDNSSIKIQINLFSFLLIVKIMFVGSIPGGMPSVQLPSFGFTKNNTTVTFVEMCSNLGSGILVLPLISLMEDVAICKAFGKKFYSFYWHHLLFIF